MDRASASGKFTEEVPPPPPRGGGLSLTSSKQKIPGSTPGMVKRGRSRLTAGFPFCFVLFCFVSFCFVLFCFVLFVVVTRECRVSAYVGTIARMPCPSCELSPHCRTSGCV